MPVKPPPSLAPADVSPLLAGLSAGNLVLGGKDNRLINSRRCSLVGSNDLVVGGSYNHHVVGSEEENKQATLPLVNYDASRLMGQWDTDQDYYQGDVVIFEGLFYVWSASYNLNALETYFNVFKGINLDMSPSIGYLVKEFYDFLNWERVYVNVSASGNIYSFDGFSSSNEVFGLNLGTYYFSNIPQSYPIAFINKNKPVRYGGSFFAGRADVGGYYYDFYYGDVVVHIEGDFGKMSYCSLSNGYMGGYQNLVFDETAPSPGSNRLTVNLDYSEYTENALTQNDKNTLRRMCDYFENVIIEDSGVWESKNINGYRYGESLSGSFSYQLRVIDFSSGPSMYSSSGGTLAFASTDVRTREDPNYAKSDYGFYVTPTGGRMAVDPLDLDYLRQKTEYPNKNKLYWTMLHEVAHAFGIGRGGWNVIWGSSIGNNFIRLTEENGAQYIGKNAVREYNRLVGGNFDSLPIQTLYVPEDPDPDNIDPNRKIPVTFTSLSLSLSEGADQLIFEIVDQVIYVLNSGDWPQLSAPGFEDGFYIFHGAGQDPEFRFWNDPWKPSNNTDYIDLIVKIPESLAPYVPGNFPSSAIGQAFDYVMYITWRGHWAELPADSITDGRKYRLYTNPDGTTVEQPYITEEIMTPYFDGYAPWTRISTAFLHDLGYIVDYSQNNPIFDTSNEYSIIEPKNYYKETTELITNPYFTTNLNDWNVDGDVELVEDGLCIIKNQGSISQNINLFTNVTYYLNIKIRGSLNVIIENTQISSQYVDSGNPVPGQWDASKIYQYGEVVYHTLLSAITNGWVDNGGVYIYVDFDPAPYFSVGDNIRINGVDLVIENISSTLKRITTTSAYNGESIDESNQSYIYRVINGIYQRKSWLPGTSGINPDPYVPPGQPDEYVYWEVIELDVQISYTLVFSKKFGHELAQESSFEIPIISKTPSQKLKITHESGVSCSVIQVSLNRQLIKNNTSSFIEDNHAMIVYGQLNCSGDVFTSHISDKRLKEHIKPIDNCLERVLGMSAIQFDWNDKQNVYRGHDIGIIAQQAEKVCPEIVETRKSGFKAIRYEKISALLVGSIKESQEKINKIKEKINYES